MCSKLTCSEDDIVSRQVIYQVQAGHLKEAVDLYMQTYKKNRSHNTELLHNMGLLLIDQGWRSSDLETQVMALFGAGISAHDSTMYILEAGLRNPIPQIQLLSLNLLSKYQHDDADEALNLVLGSNELLIRFEALAHLTEKKHPKAFGQIEALMSKVPAQLHPLFPPFFAKLGGPRALAALKRLLAHPDQDVRIAAILSAAKYGQDELLPQIRILATHHEIPQQEACAVALGLFKDSTSLPQLQKMAKSTSPNLQIAALLSLYKLGLRESKEPLQNIAKKDNLFAIYALGEIAGTESCLKELLDSSQLNVRVNAAMSLLKRKDPACLKVLAQVLIYDSTDVCLNNISSVGKGLAAFKAIPSAQQNFASQSLAYELTLSIKEDIMEQSLALSEKDFLSLAERIFIYQQNDLIPTTVHLLTQLQTPKSIELLKNYQQKAGAPLVRNYCNLALCQLKEPGPYQELLSQWVVKQQNLELINFRSYVPWEFRELETKFELTPHESSGLLIEAFEMFAKQQEDKGIEIILEAMANGNSKNRYALAGLLIRAAM